MNYSEDPEAEIFRAGSDSESLSTVAYSLKTAAATFGHPYLRTEARMASADNNVPAGFEMTFSMLFASLRGVKSAATWPVLPSSIISSMAPTRLATTGVPQASDSSPTSPKLS